MDIIPEPIRGKLASVGYTSIDQLPNDKNVDIWNKVQTGCGLLLPELTQLINIRFPEGHSSMVEAATAARLDRIEKSIAKGSKEAIDMLKRQKVDHSPSILTLVSPSIVQNDVEMIGGLIIDKFEPSSQNDASLFPQLFDSRLDEHQLIALSTNRLNSLAIDAGYEEFVNSEEYPWIQSIHCQNPDPKNDYKPDGLLSLKSLYETKKASGSAEIKDFRANVCNGVSFMFGRGVFDIKDMFGPIIEYKSKMTASDRGKLYGYLQHLSYRDKVNKFRGVLVDSEKFLAVQCSNGFCVSAVLGSITDKGSYTFLAKFLSLKNRWLLLLQAVCSSLGVELVRPEEGSTAFLGAGRCGRCFAVKKMGGDGRILALKIVLLLGTEPVNATLVNCEYERMLAYGGVETLQPYVMRVLPNTLTSINECSTVSSERLGVGYLMEAVGKTLPASLEYYRAAVRSLAALHSHEPPVYHGDARSANVVLLDDGSVRWIDWMLCQPLVGKRISDLKQFIDSIKRGVNVWDNPTAKALLDEYGREQAAGRDLETIAVELVELVHGMT